MASREEAQVDIDVELFRTMHVIHDKVMQCLLAGRRVLSSDISREFLDQAFDDLLDQCSDVLQDLSWQEIEDEDFAMDMRHRAGVAVDIAIMNTEQEIRGILNEICTGQLMLSADVVLGMLQGPFGSLRERIGVVVNAAVSEASLSSMSSLSAASSSYTNESQDDVVLPLRCRRRHD